jgi:hypothetical protein
VPHFFWTFTSTWHKAKKAKGLSEMFWDGQRESWEDFNKKNPMAFRPPALTTISLAKPKIMPGKAKSKEEPAKPPQVEQPLAPTQQSSAPTTCGRNVGTDFSCGWTIKKG